MTEITSAEIRIDLNDAEAIAGLRAVDAEFDRTMRDIDRSKATYKIEGDIKDLERKYAQAKKLADDYEKKVSAQENKSAKTRMTTRLAEMRQAQEQQRAEIANAKQSLAQQRLKNKELKTEDSIRQAAARSSDRQHRAEQKAMRDEQKMRDRAEASERRMLKLHSDAEAVDRKRTYNAITGTAKQERAVQKLQSRYAEMERTLDRLNRKRTKLSTIASADVSQRVDLKRADAVKEMAVLEAELRAMGAKPIEQHVKIVDERHANQLSSALSGLSDTAVRLGPITTSIAGLGRGLALLGPIVVGIVGQVGALVSVLGSGLGGALGATGAALGAFAVSLGGVALLMPSLFNDFKNLNTLQNAYHVQVLKTGANSDKAKKKLKEFNHALGEVPSTTRAAFDALDNLKNAWTEITKDKSIQKNFGTDLTQTFRTINHQIDWFHKNTVGAFQAATDGWTAWMKGLRSNEADKIFADLGKQGNKSIKPLMGALGALGTAFGRIAQSFARYLPGLMRGFQEWAQNIADATGESGHLNKTVDRMVGAMRDLGHFAQAAGRFLIALFAPGADPGRKMLQSWTDGLNRTAEAMEGVKRKKIRQFFVDAIDTANKFWSAMKPLVQIFFEWSTIMRPFTGVAIAMLGALGKILNVMLQFAPLKGVMQGLFGLFLVAQFTQRVGAVARSIVLIKDAILAMKAAGGLGAALKTGALSQLFNPFHGAGQPGATPAHPMFTREIGLGGGRLPGGGAPGGPVGGPAGGGGMLNMLKALPRFVKIGGGITALAAGFDLFRRAADKAAKDHGLDQLNDKVQKLVNKRDMAGLMDLKRYMQNFGGNNKDFIKQIDQGVAAIDRLDGVDLHNATRSITEDYNRLKRESKVTFARVSGLANYHFDLIKNTMTKGSHSAAKAAELNFGKAKKAIQSSIKAGVIDSDKGMRLIERLWIKALQGFGFTPKAARALANRPHGSTQTPGADGTLRPNARGGLYQIGARGARGVDSVPMNLGGVPSIVAPGEQIAVFNHHQQRKMASLHPGGLEGFFSGHQRSHSFAQGGIVPVPGFPGESAASSVIPMIEMIAKRFGLALTDAYGQGHKSPGHTRFGTAADFAGPDRAMDAAVQYLVRAGYVVGYDGRFGSQNWPGHGPRAVAGGNAHLHVELGGKGGIAAMMKDIVAPVVQGDLGVISSIAQGVLNTTTAAANANLQLVANSMAAPVAGGGGAAMGDGPLKAVIAQALHLTNHYSPANASALFSRVMQESGGNPNAINLWDSNAKAGHPSKGLGQTIDSTFQSFRDGSLANNIFDPLANLVASINYMFATYGHIVGANGQGYNQGGIVSMNPTQWKRGGKVMQPTMLTGEDGRDHPEFIVGTNPQFRKSNVAALQAAAAQLGVPTARDSTKHKGPKKLKNSGRDVEKIGSVKRYGKLQQDEDDKTRQISIAEARVKEPDTLIKQTGTDAEGNALYEVDQKAIDKYTGQMKDVRKLYEDLIGKKGKGGIMSALRETGTRAVEQLNSYRNDRTNNIGVIKEAIKRDEKLLKSKDKSVRKAASKRLEHNRGLLGDQRQKRSDAVTKRGEIQSDLHDAAFRVQEYGNSKRDLQTDISAVSGRAADEAKTENPQPEKPEAVDPNELRGAALDAELALAQIGQGVNGQPPRSEQAILTDQAAFQQTLIDQGKAMLKDNDPSNDVDAYNQISSAASALQSIQGELAKFDPTKNAQALAAAVREATTAYGNNFVKNVTGASQASLMGARAVGTNWAQWRTPGTVPPKPGGDVQRGAGMMGSTVVNLKPTFANVPPDPHTWSKAVAFEIQAAF